MRPIGGSMRWLNEVASLVGVVDRLVGDLIDRSVGDLIDRSVGDLLYR